jgi:hypothetical protein
MSNRPCLWPPATFHLTWFNEGENRRCPGFYLDEWVHAVYLIQQRPLLVAQFEDECKLIAIHGLIASGGSNHSCGMSSTNAMADRPNDGAKLIAKARQIIIFWTLL